MPHLIQQLNDKTLCATIRGALGEADYAAMHDAARPLIVKAEKINVLIVLQDFFGLERGGDWGNVDFFAEHGGGCR